MPDKAKHYTLHFTKYFTKYCNIMWTETDDVIIIEKQKQIMIDTMLISLSFANSLSVVVDDIDILNGFKSDALIHVEYANTLQKLAKALDSLDHIERFPIREKLDEVPPELIKIVATFIYQNNIKDFEHEMMKRYQMVRDKRLM